MSLKSLADKFKPSKTDADRLLLIKMADAIIDLFNADNIHIGPFGFNAKGVFHGEILKQNPEKIEKVLSILRSILNEGSQ